MRISAEEASNSVYIHHYNAVVLCPQQGLDDTGEVASLKIFTETICLLFVVGLIHLKTIYCIIFGFYSQFHYGANIYISLFLINIASILSVLLRRFIRQYLYLIFGLFFNCANVAFVLVKFCMLTMCLRKGILGSLSQKSVSHV